MIHRLYDPEKDRDAVHQIWLETGWIEKDNPKPMDAMIENSQTIVADINGSPECLVVSFPGDIDYLGERLKFSCIGGVTTSLIARRQHLAGRLTAEKIALDAIDGAVVSGLGIFEQGYYDKLGFGTLSYERVVKFSPSNIKLDLKSRVPDRLGMDDWEKMHRARLGRRRLHGSCSMDSPHISRAEMLWTKKGFGFGYHDENGELTHYAWMNGVGKEHGPFEVNWMAYRSLDQFLELMALFKSFSEQIHLISMLEPPGLQLVDFLEKPLTYAKLTDKSTYKNFIRTNAYYQMRICDLGKCLEKTHLRCDEFRFNLRLSDPIERFLDDEWEWRGIGGDYLVTLGRESRAERGSDPHLPTLEASAGVFTRMWFGVLPASSLAVFNDFNAPAELLDQLDQAFLVPLPHTDWDF